MNRKQINDLWEAIKANRKRLDECPKHRFDLGEAPYRINQRATCLNCHGEMELNAINQYRLGYRAAGGNPNDIVPGWE